MSSCRGSVELASFRLIRLLIVDHYLFQCEASEFVHGTAIIMIIEGMAITG